MRGDKRADVDAGAAGSGGGECTQRADESRALCCRCAHSRRVSPLTCLAICFLVLTYNLLGGFLFLALEGGGAEDSAAAVASMPGPRTPLGPGADLRARTVERLWAITEDLNILYKENWTQLAAAELLDFQQVLLQRAGGAGAAETWGRSGVDTHRWTFSSSFLYALTLITTIGHGNVTPRSSVGKLVAIAYACIGIPIVMLYLATVGEALARNFRALYSRLCPSHNKRPRPATLPSEREKRTPFQAALNLDLALGEGRSGEHWTCGAHTRVPLPLSALLLAVYVALGALLFRETERWSTIEGCYFSFSSLATIGFGDLRPGGAALRSPRAGELALAACCGYILVGVAVVAMAFNLIREDAAAALRSLARPRRSPPGTRPAPAPPPTQPTPPPAPS